MTVLNSQVVVGVDVAKDEIVVYRSDLDVIKVVSNARSALNTWLKTPPANSPLAIEATTELAHEMGHDVYVIDCRRFNRYCGGINVRAKTDALYATLLMGYLRKSLMG
ncbi:hypothetical protein [Pseudomonas fluorescens]|uniref:IS110 family transposase n=1 Tax=Pseudomonas fluorescens TaxID=294 RepID=A0A423LKM4_PSEFL|nr:hypothetical protein [Pseudomonas fluorescens]RON68788.1 hypothetical protein BK671_10625 [Pseudomonas fluorescens]